MNDELNVLLSDFATAFDLSLALIAEETTFYLPPGLDQWLDEASPAQDAADFTIQIGKYGAYYLTLLLDNEQRLILGPIILSDTDADQTFKNLFTTASSLSRAPFDQYFRLHSAEKMTAVTKIICRILEHHVPKDWHFQIKATPQQKPLSLEFEKTPQSKRTPYVQESLYYLAISQGDRNETFRRFQAMTLSGRFGVLTTHSEIRNLKNLFIASVTLITRAAIQGGLNEDTAYSLSDKYIQMVEELSTATEISKLYLHVSNDFVCRVAHIRQFRQHPPLITKTIQLIEQDPNRSLKSIATELEVSESHLSRLFKTEMGRSFSKYKQAMMMQKACNMITYTTDSLMEISIDLGFNEFSYFSRVFKEVVGMTPTEFKKKHRRLPTKKEASS